MVMKAMIMIYYVSGTVRSAFFRISYMAGMCQGNIGTSTCLKGYPWFLRRLGSSVVVDQVPLPFFQFQHLHISVGSLSSLMESSQCGHMTQTWTRAFVFGGLWILSGGMLECKTSVGGLLLAWTSSDNVVDCCLTPTPALPYLCNTLHGSRST